MKGMDNKSVFVVIVTFRRPAVLDACLQSLATQHLSETDRVHVVVNSNDAETLEVINSNRSALRASMTHEVLNNEGPAGGFYAGIEKFLKESQTKYVWLMDDDIIVDTNCLEELLKSAENCDYIFPRVITAAGEEIVSFGWWGVLLGRRLIEKVGLPVKELFYWAEDTEYLQNRIMRQFGIQPVRCRDANVKHLHNRIEKRPSWYYYYATRNTLYYRSYIAGYTKYRLKRTLYLLPYMTFIILSKEKNKLRKIGLMIYGAYHGLIGKIGKVIDPGTHL
jgi:rhamnopyranosyl-N-acetylglucosaminyl-diphospho-decaprenol beta-1,3/1,4-galactofuranosyltransferase